MGKKGKRAKGDGVGGGDALPKTIAGVKVPKRLRKTGAAALKLTHNPIVSDVVTAALLAAAASLGDSKRVRRGAKAVGDGAAEAADETAREAGRLAAALAAAAGAAGTALLEAVEDLAAGDGKRRKR